MSKESLAANFEIETVNGRIEFGIWDTLVDWWNSFDCHFGDDPQSLGREMIYCHGSHVH